MRIVHLGFGRFHRAHQAYYTHLANQNLSDSEKWKITAVSLRTPEAVDQLRENNFVYHVLEKSVEESSVKRESQDSKKLREQVTCIDCIDEAFFAPLDAEKIIERMSDPETRVVTLTVTEKGYYALPGTQKLDLENSDIQWDLANPERPKTVLGFLAQAIKLRIRNKAPLLTLLSADNLRKNGDLLRSVLDQFLEKWSRELGSFMKNNYVTLTNSMVDRIVPATTSEDVQSFYENHGIKDSSVVVTEAYCAWVIEKPSFDADLPPWESVGVQFVEDVSIHEEIKLRFLNASHSYLSYFGRLKGYEFVHQAASDTELEIRINSLIEKEVAPLLILPSDFDVAAAVTEMIHRFKNPALEHRLEQIGRDGSQKIPQRILPNLFRQNSSRSPLEIPVTLEAIASFMLMALVASRKVESSVLSSSEISFSDPKKEALFKVCDLYFENKTQFVEEFLSEIGEKRVLSEEIKKALVEKLDTLVASMSLQMNSQAAGGPTR